MSKSSITHRGTPALPGDSPRFDLYDGLREFLISTKRKGIRNERVPEPEPYEMGLQISRGVYTEAAEEACLRGAAPAFGRDVSRIGLAQGSEDSGRAPDGRPRTYLHQHSAEVRCIECGRIPEGEKRDSDCAEVWSAPEELHGRAFWARGYFVSTVGLDENMVRAYIRNQEDEDEWYDQMKLAMG